jgi:hypothetical protein
VDRLSGDLAREGIETWLDVEQIEPGANWLKAVETGLRQASALIYIASGQARGSRWMNSELTSVSDRGLPVIPVIVDDEGLGGLPSTLQQYQWIDFRHRYTSALEELVGTLQRVRHTRSVAPTPAKSKGYVFLSYAEEDSQFAERLKRFLAGRGYAYWDYQESDRDYHGDLYLELEGIISEAAGTLSILSPFWKKSPTAIKEYHFSVEVGTPVFLLKAQVVGPILVIAGIPFIDFTGDEDSAFLRLANELKRKGL